jgi:hypothetical protein
MENAVVAYQLRYYQLFELVILTFDIFDRLRLVQGRTDGDAATDYQTFVDGDFQRCAFC